MTNPLKTCSLIRSDCHYCLLLLLHAIPFDGHSPQPVNKEKENLVTSAGAADLGWLI